VSKVQEQQERDLPSTETGHDDGLSIIRRKLHDGRLDRDSDLGSGSESSEVSSTLTVSG